MPDRADLTASPITPAQAAEFIHGRRSVDNFTPDVPDPERVREAIALARWAPNHRLTQPWRFYLLGEESQIAIIDLNSRLVRQTRGEDAATKKRERWQAVPGWLAVTCVVSDDPITAREDYAACACAIQNLMLYLHSAGVASKWTTGAVTREPEFLHLLGADPDAEYTVALIWYGYAKRAPRSQQRDLEEILIACP
jgi:nitroreductase